MAYRYAIVGSGRQGTAAAYDLIRFGEAEAVLMADLHLSQAQSAAKRLNERTGETLTAASTVDASSEKSVEFPPPIGTLEAFTTSGGLTTASRTFAGQLRTLQNKTMRYPGHLSQLTTMQHLGLFDLEPIQVGDQEMVPRDVLHSLWEPQIAGDRDEHDMAIIRVHARGLKEGQPTLTQADLTIHFSETTRLTAMEQGTGWHASIFAAAIASGEVPHGVVPVELAMSGSGFVERASFRGLDFNLNMSPLESR